jgi:FKBP-type peptidyl-prolyl cis-trans isomerase 2
MKKTVAGVAALVLVLFLAGCAAAKVADKEMVSISYKGTLPDGSVFSEAAADAPYEFLVGGNATIPALEKGMLGLKVGDKKTITIKAADAYGEYSADAIQEVPKDQFPAGTEFTVGMVFSVQTGQGNMPVTVKEIKAKSVMMDFNHPLAGKNLTFDVSIVKIRAATKDELAAAAQAAQATPQ